MKSEAREKRTTEGTRLEEDARRRKNWTRWGPYLSERQWGTVREDYSPNGESWTSLPHDHARSRAYRWGEDGLLGITDRECRLCFALALWNRKDPILKERLFGLTGPEGNHGEDVKEIYHYLDSTPSHSYLAAQYRYPQAEFPYRQLVEENRWRGKADPEYELVDTGVFRENRYFDIRAEYAKESPDDILVRVTVVNRGSEAAPLEVLPTLWFRNTWSWGCTHEGCEVKPRLERRSGREVTATHSTLGTFRLVADFAPGGARPELLFTENETNTGRLFGVSGSGRFFKDGFDEYVIQGRSDAVNPDGMGTKAAFRYSLVVPAQGEIVLRLRLFDESIAPAEPLGRRFDATFEQRRREADEFYAERVSPLLDEEESRVARQAYAGLLWSKQFYHYVIKSWLAGDPAQPAPPGSRRLGRNHDWEHLFNRDVISMPDKWEYPWYAAWDLAFHMIPFARIHPRFAKDQLVLFLREWYMHPNGQLPAYEFALSDVNPPVHAWACWRVYKMTGRRGKRDRLFLARVFQKLLMNFTWWVNRKDINGRNLFSGGFLGLDNIGVFDRSKTLPAGGQLEQADGTAWMAFYCNTMLSMALELAQDDPAYEDVASKFFEHFVAIADAINNLGGTGLWDETDGFYYDQLSLDGGSFPLRVRSMVGLIPLFAVEVLEERQIRNLPGFRKRMLWFLENRKDLAERITYMEGANGAREHGHRLLAIPTRDRLVQVLRYLLDEKEFLSPYGIRSLSAHHRDQPYVIQLGGEEHRVSYVPGESDSGLFGGNSNWRGPIWFPVNFLLVEALERYHHFYGDSLKVECPTGSGRMLDLSEVASEISRRLARIFLRDDQGRRPFRGTGEAETLDEPILFHEYFHAETGRGVGASHQTGWTALIASLLDDQGKRRGRAGDRTASPALETNRIRPSKKHELRSS